MNYFQTCPLDPSEREALMKEALSLLSELPDEKVKEILSNFNKQ